MIGILTFFQSCNYGAFLQAYALQNYLKKIGYSNILINYRKQQSIDNELNAFFLPAKNKPLLYLKLLIKISKFKYCQHKFRKTKWISKREDLESIAFDTIIVGSDQIWCYTKEWGGIDTPYFSNNLNAKYIFSYAASMGPDRFDNRHPKSILRLLKNFKELGVRDSNTFNFAKLYGNSEPKIVLDPTLLYDFTKDIKKVRLKNYILFYTDGLLPRQEIIDQLRNLAKKKNLKIVSIGNAFEWCDINIITPSPFSFMGYIQSASFVFTCMYHGLLFSVKFNKQFAMFLTPERENKCLDFLMNVNLRDRRVCSSEDLHSSFNNIIHYDSVNEQLNDMKIQSESFLTDCLLKAALHQ